MRTPPKWLGLLAMTLIVAGCATSGPKYLEMVPNMTKLSPDMGRIYIYRTTVLGAAIQPDVKVNGEVVGSAVPNGFFYVDRSSGT
jgi:hypothetical protein